MPPTPQSMGSKGYMFILMACLPVILCQSPTSSPSESPKPSPYQVCADAVYPIECEEALKNAGGDCKKALISSLKAIQVKVSETLIAINKTLPGLVGDEKVSHCLSETARVEYNNVISAIEDAIESVEKKDESGYYDGVGNFYTVDLCFQDKTAFYSKKKDNTALHPIQKENEVLIKMTDHTEDLTKCMVWVEQEDEY